MKIIIFSGTTAKSIASDLGKSEYSYYFVLRAYLPVLEKLGELVFVDDPETQVDDIYKQALENGDSAVFLSFSPPHRTTTSFSCPTVCVLAWEFSSVPDRDLGNGPRDNWVKALEEAGNVVTISDYSSSVIGGQVGGDLYLATIPAPVTDKPVPAKWKVAKQLRPKNRRELALTAEIIDTRELVILDDVVYPKSDGQYGIDERDLPAWNGSTLQFHFDGFSQQNNGSRQLVGFHTPESWGAWARSDQPWINLPVRLSGDFELNLQLVGFGENVGRSVDISVGNQTRSVSIDGELREYQLQFTGVDSGTYIAFSNLVTCYTVGADLLRALSLGVGDMTIDSSGAASVEPQPLPEQAQPLQLLQLSGVVYTSVFNPEDGRKNWEDILKAFCWAFREDSEATLILKMSCQSMSATWGQFLTLLSQLNPFQCRVIVVHGYLRDDEMAQLISVTDYIVNASHAEGQCLPLLEFMAEGVPAIAPDHTAMASYIRPHNSFVVKSWKSATCWPQDKKEIKRTFFYGIDWESLVNNFEESAQLVRDRPNAYVKMAYRAMSDIRKRYSLKICESLLTRYLEHFEPESESSRKMWWKK